MMSLLIGLGVLLFGLIVGGAGLVFAGIGIGIPMVPLGLYLSYRGWRIYKHEKKLKMNPSHEGSLKPLEKTKIGKFSLGILLILFGVGASAMVIGIPILLAGVWFIFDAFRNDIKNFYKSFNKKVS